MAIKSNSKTIMIICTCILVLGYFFVPIVGTVCGAVSHTGLRIIRMEINAWTYIFSSGLWQPDAHFFEHIVIHRVLGNLIPLLLLPVLMLIVTLKLESNTALLTVASIGLMGKGLYVFLSLDASSGSPLYRLPWNWIALFIWAGLIALILYSKPKEHTCNQ